MLAVVVGAALVAFGGLINAQTVKVGTSNTNHRDRLRALRSVRGGDLCDRSNRMAEVNQAIWAVVAPWLWRFGIFVLVIGVVALAD